MVLAERQHGVVARRQLLAAGLSSARIGRWIAAGRLLPLRPGVYALGHRPATSLARWMTDGLSAGDDAVVIDRSSAALWDLGIIDRITAVAVPRTSGRAKGRGVQRRADIPPDEVTIHRGIRTTTVARTLVDLGRVVTPAQLRRAVEKADQLELFDLRAITPILERRRGRPGVHVLERLIADAAAHGMPRTRSILEARFLEFCIAAGLPRPQVNRYDDEGEVDFRWPHARLVAETDGWQYHRTRRAFERDAQRSLTLAAEGWTLVRITWRQLTREPDVVAARLRPLLNGGS